MEQVEINNTIYALIDAKDTESIARFIVYEKMHEQADKDDTEIFAEGSIKWDGCIDITYGEWFHTCGGVEGFEERHKIMVKVLNEVISRFKNYE